MDGGLAGVLQRLDSPGAEEEAVGHRSFLRDAHLDFRYEIDRESDQWYFAEYVKHRYHDPASTL